MFNGNNECFCCRQFCRYLTKAYCGCCCCNSSDVSTTDSALNGGLVDGLITCLPYWARAICLPVMCGVFAQQALRVRRIDSEEDRPILAVQPQNYTTFCEPPVIPSKDLVCGKTLGRGGFGVVYQGNWGASPVAIKKFTQQPQSNGFTQELDILSGLNHPNIIILYGKVTESPKCLVLELMQKTLWDILHSRHRTFPFLTSTPESLPWTQRYSFAHDIALGLEYLHQQGILHRDLKATNILANQYGQLKLSDFDTAKKLDSPDGIYQSQATKAVGTFTHVAPEVFQHRRYNRQTDIFAYAMTLWEIASRKAAYARKDEQMIILHVTNDLRETIPPSTPPIFTQIIEDCWVTNPADRPLMPEVLERLRAIMHTSQTSV